MSQGNPNQEMETFREQISSLFRTAPSSSHQQSVGLELELLPLKRHNSGKPTPVDITNDSGSGTLDIVRRATQNSTELTYSPKDDGTPQFSSSAGGNITFEPGGQIEYSSSECYHLKTAIIEMVKHVDIISSALGPENIELFHGGINPWYSVEEVGLKMRKARYIAMDEYFRDLGPYGQKMMRLTLSIQANLDFGDQRTARKRWFGANLLAPIMCAVFGNTPFADNRPTGQKSYRSFIWQNMDHCRTGFPNPENLACPEMDQVDQYLIYALDAYVIKLYHDAVIHGEKERFITFRQWMQGNHPRLQPDMDAWKEHISLLFPEVRPKGFLEFRTLDGPSRHWWTVPITLLASILYDDKSLDSILELMEPYCQKLDEMMEKAAADGVSAFPEIVHQAIRIGLESEYTGIPDELKAHIECFFQHFTFRNQNPADGLSGINNGQVFNLEQFHDYEDHLKDILNPPDYTIFSRHL